MKKILLFCFALAIFNHSSAQETFPVNGAWDIRPGQYAFTNATIVVNPDQTIANGTLLVKDRLIEAVGQGISVPKGYITVDLKGKYIYPGLVDAFSTYGLPEAPRQAFGAAGFGAARASVPVSTKPGAFGWNEAIRADVNAKTLFHVNATRAEEYKRNGFGAVQTLVQDGIVRGTSAVVSLGNERDNEVMLNDQAAANYSFSKGTAATNYPSSLMGVIALLRQTYLDAQWYKNQKEEYNISLAEFNRTQTLPQLFEVTDLQSIYRADKIAREFGKQYILKSDGDEYQNIAAVKATGRSFIIPLTFPAPYDVEDPLDARNISYEQLKGWELAPTNPGALEKAGIRFAITSNGLTNSRDFWTNLRTAINYGLTEKQALKALTQTPAEMLGVADKIGTLAKGKMANFIITSDGLFKPENIIYENWIEGRQFVVNKMDVTDLRGTYTFNSNVLSNINLSISGTPSTYTVNITTSGADSLRTTGTITRTGDLVSVYYNSRNQPAGVVRLSGYIASTSPITLNGTGITPDGTSFRWTATRSGAAPANGNPFARGGNTPNASRPASPVGPVVYPFAAFGFTEVPKTENVLFKNATVWTNEKDGILKNADVLIENGKIKAVGKNLSAGNAKVIDATGKHISPGIIDEHSHIAAIGSINEATQAVTSEVRIGDVLDATDIQLYRQLAGGVTTSQILHGSANPIGGQNYIIKHRWGVTPEQLKFENAPQFIKFALGENVKQSNRPQQFGDANTRFPQTRMGVEQVYIDAFTRAKEYKAARAVKGNNVRRDLELDALVEILDDTRHITCHSYVQSEINMLMHVADSMHFKINTFTHILEGYKVADKMKARNIAASTFSDWWAYKMEVQDAIPYNANIMHSEGLTVAINSDDAEMARRLNQEAGKSVTYGKMSEEEALKLVTLNPAKMLHIDGRVGSIRPGKDADLVVWSADPLSIYAVAEKTYIDGVPYWDYSKDADRQKAMKADEGRIIQKMLQAKNAGASTQRVGPPRRRQLYTCDDIDESAYVVADEYNGWLKTATDVKQQSAQNNQNKK
ncbi:amidohydrolase family protein [Mucilaginibacter arboris]|uniref:Amidohydrolase family protein n=1 Tax=Mucilaginibacter arboris TaxID=2682090 RepID=A0A7K1SSG5_9SPHI|nr:amidohydrolase family protein [Mucilaginibacter arboris]MVN20187.1 amidohydrolase family protein [Mucilaginibacter arboris]